MSTLDKDNDTNTGVRSSLSKESLINVVLLLTQNFFNDVEKGGCV